MFASQYLRKEGDMRLSEKCPASNVSHSLEQVQRFDHACLFESLQRIEDEYDSLLVILKGYRFTEDCCLLGALKRITLKCGSFGAYSKLTHLCKTVSRTKEACNSLHMFLDDFFSQEFHDSDTLEEKKHDFLETLWDTNEEYSSLIYSNAYLVPVQSLHHQTLERIREARHSFVSLLKEYMFSFDMFLRRDFKFLDVILNLQTFIDESSDVIKEVHALSQGASADLVVDETRISFLQRKFQLTKLKIREKYSSSEFPFKDGTATSNSVIEFFDTVTKNLTGLLEFNDPSSPLCVGGLIGQVENALKELKFLRRFVCFVSDRCIQPPQAQHTFFTHVLRVAWHTIMITWLYFPSHKHKYPDSAEDEKFFLFFDNTAADEKYPLLFDLLQSNIQPIEPSICKIYIDVLQDLKMVRSRWYPIIQIKYIVDCEVEFVETLLHHLEKVPVSRNCIQTKSILQEMLNFLRANLINLPIHAQCHHQDIDSIIVDAGLLVYSLNQERLLDFPVSAQSVQARISLISTKLFLSQFSLSRIDRVGSADFILDNHKEFLGLYSNSIDSVKSQLETIQKELKCFQAVVEQQDGLQQFATRAIALGYGVEYICDACKEKDVPDSCIFIWIVIIGEDIRVLMAEVDEIQEKKDAGITQKDAATSSQFSRNHGMNEEMVGLLDVMEELSGKLTKGSSNLDVISIIGMPGAGKTTMATKLYFDPSIVSHFDIRAKCCVSQEYTQKDLLVAILGDIIGETDKLDKEADDVLADKLRRLLMHHRYLILIDDVWKTSAWDDLRLCFPEDYNGSRIILTARNYDVASYAKHVSDPLVLRLMSTDEGWTLLQKKVFNKESCPPVLRDIGKRIAQKCGGLPLSIVLVGGILAKMEMNERCWEEVETTLGPHVQALSEDTIDLSYQNLPHHLRPCFLYFGLFPEGKEIQVSKLTWVWISEGFVTAHVEKLLEDIAKDYLENLVARNLVTVTKKSSDGRMKACVIHDLLLEFCRKKGKSVNFSERIKGDNGRDPSHAFPPRRLSLYSRCDNIVGWCLSLSHVKSFQFREARKIAFSSLYKASYTFKRFKFLRVLDLEFTIIDSPPQEITLLKYLAFRTSQDTLSLPANLWNLETLIVQGIKGRVTLPDTIWKMVKLRHLHIYDQASFTLGSGQEFSESQSTLDDLQTLSSVCFSCVDNVDKILEKMPNIQKLRCEVSKFDGSFPAFNNLKMLKMLKISSGHTSNSINQLKLPSYLKKLTLSGCHVHLNEVAMHPKLEVLKLTGVTIRSNVWEVSDEQFLNLKFLKLENPSFFEWDVSDDAFPCLEHLVLKRCRHLKDFPSNFEYAASMKLVEIISCNEALVRSAMAVKEACIENTGTSGFEVFINK